MKKLTKVLIIALSIALLCGAFIFSASAAAESAPAATTAEAFRVEGEYGDLLGNYVKLTDAINAIPANGKGKITMIANYEDGDNFTQISIPAGKTVTLDLNGKTFTASYCAKTKEDGSVGPLYQKFNVTGSLTVVGNGTMVSATSLFNILSGGSLTLNPGSGKTINFKAIRGYNMDSKELVASGGTTFPGINFIKVGTNNLNASNATLDVTGNITFKDETGKQNLYVFAYTDGSLINIENANINCTNNGKSSGVFANHFSATYDKETYDAPVINITNSVINAPYGSFFDANNKATDYSDAPVVTIEGSTLNLVGDNFPIAGEGAKSAVFNMADKNVPLKVVMTDTKVYTDSNLFCGKCADEVPLATIQLNGCVISIDTAAKCDNGDAFSWGNTYNYRRYAFYGVVTAVVDDTAFIHEGSIFISNIMINTHAWGTKDQAVAAGKTDPGYFGELGMGVLFKSGTSFIACRSDALQTAVAAGTYGGSAFTGYALEEGKAVVSQVAWIDGAPYSGNVVSTPGSGYESVAIENVEAATVGAYTNGTNVVGGSFGTINVDSIKNRNGKYTICEYGGNKYFTHEAQDGTHQYKSDPFIPLSWNAGSGAPYTKAIDDSRFYSFEMDVAPADVAHSRGSFTAAFLFRPSIQYLNVSLATDSTGKMVWKIGNVILADATVDPGVWQHVQVIIEAPVTESGAFDTANADNFTIYLYVNGELVGRAVSLREANAAAADSIKNATDLKTVAITETRFKFPSSYYADDTGSTAFDNFMQSRYPIDYTGGKTTAADILATVVNKDYELLANLPNLPYVEVEGKYYNDIEEAYEELVFNAFDGYVPTINFLMNVSNRFAFDPTASESYEEGAEFYFVTGGAKVNLAPDCGYLAEDVGNGKYLVRPITEDDMATVTWYDRAGEPIKTESALPGTVFDHPVIESPDVIENDYYKATYNAWKSGDEILTGATYEVTKDAELYLAADVVATFNEAYFNVGLNDNMVYQFYLPQEFTRGEVDGVIFGGVTIAGNSANRYGELPIGEEAYDLYNKYSTYNNFTTSYEFVVSYKAVVDGTEYELSRKYTVSPLSYVGYVLDEDNGYTAEERTHTANLLRFANEFNRVKNGAYTESINALYNTYANLCTEYEEDLLDNTNLDMGKLEDYVSAIYARVSTGRAHYAVDFKEGSKVTKVVIARNGGATEVGTYAPDNTYFDEAKTFYKAYYTANLHFYNFFGPLTITLTVDDGSEEGLTVTGTYDVNTWYNSATFESEAQKAAWGDLLSALKELGDSFYDYRYEEVEVEVGEEEAGE